MKNFKDILNIKSLLLVMLVVPILSIQSLTPLFGSHVRSVSEASSEFTSSRSESSENNRSESEGEQLSEYNVFHAVVKVGVELPGIKWLPQDFSGTALSSELLYRVSASYFSNEFFFTASTFHKRLFRCIISPNAP